MSRVSRGVVCHKKHKKILELAKGYYGRRKSCIKTAKQAVNKSLFYRYKSNRLKRRITRTDLIECLNKNCNNWSIGYKLMIFSLYKLDLKYTLPTIGGLIQSRLIHDVLFNLLIVVDR